jgi:hypothetical protein
MNSGATYLPRLAAFDPATGTPDMTRQPKPTKQIWSFATDVTGTTLTMGGVFDSVGKTSAKRLAVFQSIQSERPTPPRRAAPVLG